MSDARVHTAVAVQKEIVDSYYALASTAVDGTEKVCRLNMDTAKETLNDWYQSVVSPSAETQQPLYFQLPLAKRASQRVLTYGRQLLEISWTTQAQLAQAVAAFQSHQMSRQFQWFASNVSGNSTFGPEAANELLNRIAALSNESLKIVQNASAQVFEQASQVSQQTFDTAQRGVSVSASAEEGKTETASQERSRKRQK